MSIQGYILLQKKKDYKYLFENVRQESYGQSVFSNQNLFFKVII